MRELVVPRDYLGNSPSLDSAFQVAFDKMTLEEAHEGPVETTPWVPGNSEHVKERRMKVTSPLPAGFPDVLRKFLGGRNDIRATVRQVATMAPDANSCTVKNKTRFHILGSKLLRFGSSFELHRTDPGDIYMSAHVRVQALLPPPFKAIAESLVIETSKRNLEAYFRAVSNALSFSRES